MGSLRRMDTMDTVETVLPPDSPAVDWDPNAFMSAEEEQDGENQLSEQTENQHWIIECSNQGKEMDDVVLQEMKCITGGDEGKVITFQNKRSYLV